MSRELDLTESPKVRQQASPGLLDLQVQIPNPPPTRVVSPSFGGSCIRSRSAQSPLPLQLGCTSERSLDSKADNIPKTRAGLELGQGNGCGSELPPPPVALTALAAAQGQQAGKQPLLVSTQSLRARGHQSSSAPRSPLLLQRPSSAEPSSYYKEESKPFALKEREEGKEA
ncbi:hypothetical protein H920_15203 [Fukomys damarensis]|uniref:Uncharacterized protein n=1 Tax=Fukomys damarensis TaxID=885580 RepID=A0A091CYW9_FUKDA|nr:hypothetical protein H920_15203 [Fukomys damarensis]